MKRIVVLGSTGSIGTSTLNVIETAGGEFDVVALTAGSNLDLLRDQVRKFRPSLISVADPEGARSLAADFPSLDVLSGRDGLIEAAKLASADTVVVAVVGISGLAPTMAAVEAGKDVALANKESLVAAGDLIMAAADRSGATVLPVDSEHSAIHQILGGKSGPGVDRIVLTASGGPFRTWTAAAMAEATPSEALAHPTWKMGPKITVDSATLMNKGLEIIEAHHFFGLPEEKIAVVIHPQSLVHGMVEFSDGSLTALMASNDMRHAIAAALWWPRRPPEKSASLRLADLPALTFSEPDRDRFPALDLARSALREGGEMPVALNAANEKAVSAFLDGGLPLPAIAVVARDVLSDWSARNRPVTSIDQVLAVDDEVREMTADRIGKYGASRHGSERRC